MSVRAKTEFRYEKLTWPEINDAIELGKVCIVPCGAVEQHGPHLPLDVDIVCPQGIAFGAGKQVPEKMLVLPPVWYGYTGHVMDFPGTINTHYETFIHQVLDISKSKADIFLDRLEGLLRQQVPVTTILRRRKPTFARPAPKDLLEEIMGASDAVIEALAD